MLIRYYFDPDSASVPFILVIGEKIYKRRYVITYGVVRFEVAWEGRSTDELGFLVKVFNQLAS